MDCLVFFLMLILFNNDSQRSIKLPDVSVSSVAQLCLTLWPPWTAAYQVSLSLAVSWSLLKLMSIVLVMPSNHLILCCLFLFLPSIFPSIRVFSSELALCIRWLKYWSFSFSISISPSSEYSGLISFRIDSKEKTNCRKLSGVLFCRALTWRSKIFLLC